MDPLEHDLNRGNSGEKLSVLVVTSQDSGGGASRAIHRIYSALNTYFPDEVNVTLRVIHKSFADEKIVGGKATRSRTEYLEYFLRTRWRKYFPRRPFESDNKLLHSQALYPSGLGREINQRQPDVVLLGWLGNSTLSIKEIGRIKAPVVWRLSDMWMFSGAEHYTPLERYSAGYSKKSRPQSESGPDINRETFLRKKRHWKLPRNVICPSHWIAEHVKKSVLSHNWPVHVIPNPIDNTLWKPLEPEDARAALGLPADGKIMLFGAGSGLKDFHKGGDLLLEAVEHLEKTTGNSVTSSPVLAIFGQDGDEFFIGKTQVTFLGRLTDRQLVAAYSAADVMVVPSRQDNLPSTAVEAQACGCPVVAFEIGGLTDIVEHGKTGFLVPPFDTEAMSQAISTILFGPKNHSDLRHSARKRALELWSPQTVAAQYLSVLQVAAGKT